MKIGLGLYRHQLNREHYDFARQCGATHLVIHLVDYFKQGDHNPADNQPTGGVGGWGRAGDPDRLWTLGELQSLRQEINAAGLELAAIENFDPAHWYDVLLDGPRKAEQLENLKTIIRRLGEAGIGVMGYNFSLAGVASRITGPFARGGALSVGMDGVDDTPVPLGMVWNMVYDPAAPAGVLPEIDHDELWRRLADFLAALLPVPKRPASSWRPIRTIRPCPTFAASRGWSISRGCIGGCSTWTPARLTCWSFASVPWPR
jgi:mannonate dehydratase